MVGAAAAVAPQVTDHSSVEASPKRAKAGGLEGAKGHAGHATWFDN
jgi:hypothetical protein